MTYPIVLAHGVCRFDKIWNEASGIDTSDDEQRDLWHYFKGVRTMLRKRGYQVFHSAVSWGAGVEKRASELGRNIQEILAATGAEKVNIIAHSMGGLDARHMLFGDRHQGAIHLHVASLTTISTPHWGSPFADWGLANLKPLVKVAAKIGLDIEAFKDLTVAACTRFNNDPEVQEFESACDPLIRFQTYAGRQAFWAVFDALKMPFYIIEKQEGENDGLVSVQSARWQEKYFQGIIDKVDHLNELGWWDPGQILVKESKAELLARVHDVYAAIADRLP
jgi:triacylglycerol lipase